MWLCRSCLRRARNSRLSCHHANRSRESCGRACRTRRTRPTIAAARSSATIVRANSQVGELAGSRTDRPLTPPSAAPATALALCDHFTSVVVGVVPMTAILLRGDATPSQRFARLIGPEGVATLSLAWFLGRNDSSSLRGVPRLAPAERGGTVAGPSAGPRVHLPRVIGWYAGFLSVAISIVSVTLHVVTGGVRCDCGSRSPRLLMRSRGSAS